MKIGLFDNSLQTIGPKALKSSGFDGGVVIRKFGEEWSKILPMQLFFSKSPAWDYNSMPK